MTTTLFPQHVHHKTAPLQRALDLMAVAEFALVVVAVARFKHVFYSIWVWWVLLSIRILFTLDLAYRASRYPSVFIFLRVRFSCLRLRITHNQTQARSSSAPPPHRTGTTRRARPRSCWRSRPARASSTPCMRRGSPAC